MNEFSRYNFKHKEISRNRYADHGTSADKNDNDVAKKWGSISKYKCRTRRAGIIQQNSQD